MKFLLSGVIFLLVTQISFAQQRINKPAPNFTLTDVNGKKISLSDFKGKVVLLDFWASWCGPCRHENPSQVKLYKQLKDSGFVILGVSLDADSNAWKQAIKKDKITYPQVIDGGGWNGKVADLYNISQIPTTILIDKNGVAQYADLEGKELKKMILQLLKK